MPRKRSCNYFAICSYLLIGSLWLQNNITTYRVNGLHGCICWCSQPCCFILQTLLKSLFLYVIYFLFQNLVEESIINSPSRRRERTSLYYVTLLLKFNDLFVMKVPFCNLSSTLLFVNVFWEWHWFSSLLFEIFNQ